MLLHTFSNFTSPTICRQLFAGHAGQQALVHSSKLLLLLLVSLLPSCTDDSSIEASSKGISKVYYTRGKCDAGQQVRHCHQPSA
jgi:hypothetical protein